MTDAKPAVFEAALFLAESILNDRGAPSAWTPAFVLQEAASRKHLLDVASAALDLEAALGPVDPYLRVATTCLLKAIERVLLTSTPPGPSGFISDTPET